MLNIENINIVAGKFRVQNLSLHLQEGLCHVLVGTTGSGKTLLLETIAGLRRQESGRITFSGRDISHLEPEQRNVSYLPQDLCLFPNMLVRENICYGLRMQGIGAAEAARRLQPLAVSLDIAHLLDRHVDHLSGGEKQRTALARTLIAADTLVRRGWFFQQSFPRASCAKKATQPAQGSSAASAPSCFSWTQPTKPLSV